MDQTLNMLGMTSVFVGGFTALILDNMIPGMADYKPFRGAFRFCVIIISHCIWLFKSNSNCFIVFLILRWQFLTAKLLFIGSRAGIKFTQVAILRFFAFIGDSFYGLM